MENEEKGIKEKIDDIWESLQEKDIREIPSIQDYIEENGEEK